MNDSSGSRDRSGQPAADFYWTLAGYISFEVVVQRSRFIANALPMKSPESAKQFIEEMVRNHHDCRHVCYAWRIGHGANLQEMRSDGGEPTGTAGEPILAAIRRAKLSDTLVVVIRYFGGIKLGTGGLARAYGQAAESALNHVRHETVWIGSPGQLSFAYKWQKTVAHLLVRHGGKVVQQDYAEMVTWDIWLPNSAWSDFAAELSEASAGEVQIKAPAETDRS